jgi:hypothetical protein
MREILCLAEQLIACQGRSYFIDLDLKPDDFAESPRKGNCVLFLSTVSIVPNTKVTKNNVNRVLSDAKGGRPLVAFEVACSPLGS